MHDFSRREAIEEGTAGGGIGAYVFGVDQVADLHVRELLGQADGIQASHVGPKTEQIWMGPFLKLFKWYCAWSKMMPL